MLTLIWELVRKDLRQFTSDRKAMIISFAVPIAIASFMGMLFGNSSSGATTSKISLLVVDQDHSKITRTAIEKLSKNASIEVNKASLEDAQKAIKSGDAGVAVVYPAGFGSQASLAVMGGQAPDLKTLVDPTRSIEAQAVRGMILQATMGAIAGSDVKLPFDMTSEQETASNTQSWSGMSHAFSGMAIQGLLFWAIESAMIVLRERKQGIWKRLRSAPVASETLLFGRLLSAAMRAFLIIAAVLGFGMAVFGIRVHGSWLGLLILAAAASVMASSFGLFVASLGKTEAQSRGLTVLAVLGMVMLGGAWYPTFLMPAWIQSVSRLIPVRYAVDGLDGATWRGASFGSSVANAGFLFVFSVVFTAIALRRFRYEAET